MRKHIITPTPQVNLSRSQDWLNLEHLVQVEITSEDPEHPIESALLPGRESGWRAASPGEQTIRLIFDQPQNLTRIRLLFIETETQRTQEFVLQWSADAGRTFREIVRQQWNFSPPGTIRQEEEYRVNLTDATELELTIIPNKGGGEARASLAQLRLA